MRHPVRVLSVIAWAILTMAPVYAKNYPDRPVKIIVPYSAGGGTDLVARLVAEAFASAFGQSFVVENQPGAGGTIGVANVARAKPDGYTLGIGTAGTQVIVPNLDATLTYRPERDFETIAMINSVDLVLTARPDLPVQSLQELIAYAKANPGKLSYGTPGVAGSVHLFHAYLDLLNDIEMLHVPFPGEAQSISAMLSNTVDISLITVTSGRPYFAAGRLRPLAAGGPKRSPLLPDILTVVELTGLDYAAYTWNVLIAPKGTPREIQQVLNEKLADAFRRPEIQKKMNQLGAGILEGSIDAATEFVSREDAIYKKVIKATGIKRE